MTDEATLNAALRKLFAFVRWLRLGRLLLFTGAWYGIAHLTTKAYWHYIDDIGATYWAIFILWAYALFCPLYILLDRVINPKNGVLFVFQFMIAMFLGIPGFLYLLFYTALYFSIFMERSRALIQGLF